MPKIQILPTQLGSNKLHVDIFNARLYNLEIHDMNGRDINFDQEIEQHPEYSRMEIDMKRITSGIYIITVNTSKGSYVKKLYVNQ